MYMCFNSILMVLMNGSMHTLWNKVALTTCISACKSRRHSNDKVGGVATVATMISTPWYRQLISELWYLWYTCTLEFVHVCVYKDIEKLFDSCTAVPYLHMLASFSCYCVIVWQFPVTSARSVLHLAVHDTADHAHTLNAHFCRLLVKFNSIPLKFIHTLTFTI